MKTDLVAIPFANVPALWLDVAPFLAEAIERANETSLEDVYTRLMVRELQLWVAVSKETGLVCAALTTEIVVYSSRKAVRLLHVGGNDLLAWKDHLTWIGQWGLAQGATTMEAYCRPGVTKKLASNGFKKRFDVIELDLKRSMN